MSIITTNRLTSGYQKNTILHDVDFEAGKEITVIIGPNGSGKSTLLKSIFGLCEITSGSVLFDGVDITATPAHKTRRLGVSYMPQTNNVFVDLTLHENLVIASNPARPDIKKTLEFFPELQDKMHQKAKTLSGGQRQLLALAMAISSDPRVLLFDEPTANLSPKNSQMVLEKIRGIQKNRDCCVILVEQNITKSLEIADLCYVFSSGKVVYNGTAQKLRDDKLLVGRYLGVVL